MLISQGLVIKNCIVWNNDDRDPWGFDLVEESSVDASFSCFEGDDVLPGMGNTNEDPLFVEPGSFRYGQTTVTIGGEEYILGDSILDPGDYHLQEESPCIDAGTAEVETDVDMAGSPRPQGAGYDMGVYEHPEDCNENGILDYVDIADGTSEDCNGNGIPDECDIASGFSQDCN